MVSELKHCPKCLAHYTGEHTCDGLMRRLVAASKQPIPYIDTGSRDICPECQGHHVKAPVCARCNGAGLVPIEVPNG